jgi:cryptochrome
VRAQSRIEAGQITESPGRSGNWMWLSCTAFFSSFFRVYSPVAFGKKQENSNAYVRKYVPEVAKLPDKYLFEPWKAPMDAQKKAGCIVGEDYPKPIVPEDAKTHVIDKIKAAYHEGLHGADKVRAGSQRASMAIGPAFRGHC